MSGTIRTLRNWCRVPEVSEVRGAGMPFVGAAPYNDSRFEAPSGAAEFSPRRKPWVAIAHPHPHPLSRPAGEGRRRRGEGHLTQGLRPGLLYAAPGGALRNGRAEKDSLDEPLTRDTRVWHPIDIRPHFIRGFELAQA
ncbi:hypothetical protein SBA2_110011 [Acidobacteriia bacterium SbA2]|nr:hypothetical protein SBA2_110011 [Acidobacteriia bacterium SbA2]